MSAGDASADIRDFWDVDAATYDNSPSHYPQRPQEQAAWAATLRRLLPAPPATVLDMGAGTGFLSLLLAGLIRKPAPDHHGHYTEQMNATLPYRGGLTPDEAVALVEASPWGRARIERLRDVEWAVAEGLGPLDSLFGTHPRWAVIAGR